MKYEKNIVEIGITDYDHFIKVIQGKDDVYKIDFREDFIFRGISNKNFELKPSSYRKNELNLYNISNFIESDFKFKVPLSDEEISYWNINEKYILEDQYGKFVECDKNGKPYFDLIDNKSFEKKFHIHRELYVLLKFLNFADKSGLKISASHEVRKKIHNLLYHVLKGCWPREEYIEIISLAQHYRVPTRALDWSYDYKVSLYFAVENILTIQDFDENSDGVVWAFNYKLFENRYDNEVYEYQLQFYRPEYNANPNLNAQKGLFSYLIEPVDEWNDKSLDEIICHALNNDNRRPVDAYYKEKPLILIPTTLSKDEVIFYKFIIPKDQKAKILKELYLEGYSEEYIYPGYSGVKISMENRAKLSEIYSRFDEPQKRSILLKIDEESFRQIIDKKRQFVYITANTLKNIDKVFLCHNNEILGYFIGNDIIKVNPTKLWNKYGVYLNLSKHRFMNYIQEGFKIRINDFHEFKYSIKGNEKNLPSYFRYFKDDDELNFLLNFK